MKGDIWAAQEAEVHPVFEDGYLALKVYTTEDTYVELRFGPTEAAKVAHQILEFVRPKVTA